MGLVETLPARIEPEATLEIAIESIDSIPIMIGLISKLSEEVLDTRIEELYRVEKDLGHRHKRVVHDLAEALDEKKKRLAKPGCKGDWSGYLSGKCIPRKSADRLVEAHNVILAVPLELRVVAEEAGVDLYRPAITRELKVINAELAGKEPTADQMSKLVDRLDGVRVAISRKGKGCRKDKPRKHPEVVEQAIEVGPVSPSEVVAPPDSESPAAPEDQAPLIPEPQTTSKPRHIRESQAAPKPEPVSEPEPTDLSGSSVPTSSSEGSFIPENDGSRSAFRKYFRSISIRTNNSCLAFSG